MFRWIGHFRNELAIIIGAGMLVIGVRTMGWRILMLLGIVVLAFVVEVGDAIFLRRNSNAADSGDGARPE